MIRTTNLLERLFLGERRGTKIIPHAFGERAVLKVDVRGLIRAADRWRGIQVRSLSAGDSDLAPLLNELVYRPLRALNGAQDDGVIEPATVTDQNRDRR